MNDKLNAQSIERLNIRENTINLLKENKIDTLGKLERKSKTDLKKLNIVQAEIERIDIELQLLGLCLRDSN